jgi:hypothetical protein
MSSSELRNPVSTEKNRASASTPSTAVTAPEESASGAKALFR